MGSKSKSSTTANQTTTNNQTIDTTTKSFENVEGPAISDVGGDVEITTTDFGAVKAGTELGSQALDFAGDFGSEALKRSFDFGDSALGTVDKGLSRALDFGTDALDTVGGFGTSALSGVQEAQKLSADVSKSAIAKLGDALSTVGNLSRSDAANAVSDITRYAVIGVGVVVAGVTIYAITRKAA